MVNHIDLTLLKKIGSELSLSVNKWLPPKCAAFDVLAKKKAWEDEDWAYLENALFDQGTFLDALSNDLALILASLTKTKHYAEKLLKQRLDAVTQTIHNLNLAFTEQRNAAANHDVPALVYGLQNEQLAFEKLRQWNDENEKMILKKPPKKRRTAAAVFAGILLSIATFVAGCSSAEKIAAERRPAARRPAGERLGRETPEWLRGATPPPPAPTPPPPAEAPAGCHDAAADVAGVQLPPEPAELPAPVRLPARPGRVPPPQPERLSPEEQERLREAIRREIGDLMQQANRVLEESGPEQVEEYTMLVQRIRELQQRARIYR